MQLVDLNEIEATPVDPGRSVAFPVHSTTGAAASAIVWIVLEPDGEVPEHTDSAEELLYVVQGEVEATVGADTTTLHAGQLAVVPPMAPHALSNVGPDEARLLGFFASSTVVSTFAAPMGPDGEQVVVTGAPVRILAHLEEAVTLTA